MHLWGSWLRHRRYRKDGKGRPFPTILKYTARPICLRSHKHTENSNQRILWSRLRGPSQNEVTNGRPTTRCRAGSATVTPVAHCWTSRQPGARRSLRTIRNPLRIEDILICRNFKNMLWVLTCLTLGLFSLVKEDSARNDPRRQNSHRVEVRFEALSNRTPGPNKVAVDRIDIT